MGYVVFYNEARRKGAYPFLGNNLLQVKTIADGGIAVDNVMTIILVLVILGVGGFFIRKWSAGDK